MYHISISIYIYIYRECAGYNITGKLDSRVFITGLGPGTLLWRELANAVSLIWPGHTEADSRSGSFAHRHGTCDSSNPPSVY